MNFRYLAIQVPTIVTVKQHATIPKNGAKGYLVSWEPVIQGTLTFMPKKPLMKTQGSRLIVMKLNLAKTLLSSAFDLCISASTYFWYFSIASAITYVDFVIICC